MKNYIPGAGLCFLLTLPFVSIPYYLRLLSSLPRATGAGLLFIPLVILMPISYRFSQPLYRKFSNLIGAKIAAVIDRIVFVASAAFLTFFPITYYIRS